MTSLPITSDSKYVVTDINDDGYVDAWTYDDVTGEYKLFYFDAGSEIFVQVGATQTIGAGYLLQSLSGDVDADGYADVIAYNRTSQVIKILYSESNDVEIKTIGTTNTNFYVYELDLSGNIGFMDNSNTEINLYKVTNRDISLLQTIPYGARVFLDFDGNGIMDLITDNITNNSFLSWRCSSTGCVQVAVINSGVDLTGGYFNGVDINGDDKLDFRGWTAAGAAVFIGDGQGDFTSQTIPMTITSGSGTSSSYSNDSVMIRSHKPSGSSDYSTNISYVKNNILIGASAQLENCILYTQTYDVEIAGESFPEISCLGVSGNQLNSLGYLSGSYQPQPTRLFPETLTEFSLRDFNSDGNMQMYGVAESGNFHLFSSKLDLMAEHFIITNTPNYSQVRFHDYDSDGRLDFYFINRIDGKIRFVRNIIN